MKLPNRENAYIPSAKLLGYLLSKTHPVGRWKAGFFFSHGFDETNVDVLREQLMKIIHSEDIKDVVLSPHGTKYIVEGTLKTPVGNDVLIRTIWIINKGQEHPRFVTAYPL
jgi:hypothetical protein